MGNLEDMTDKQKAAWPDAIKEIARYNIAVQENPDHYDWHFDWNEESRPGRGQSFSALFIDGEHFAQIMMDVYGYPTVSVAALDIMHNGSDEECSCEFCEAERWEEYTDEERAEMENVTLKNVLRRIPRHPELERPDYSRIKPEHLEAANKALRSPVKANYAVAPGEYLLDWMQENNMPIQTVASFLHYEKRWVKQIIKGRVRLSVVIADDLEKLTGIASTVWLIFEKKYREDKERLKKTFWKRVLASFLNH
jgi:plasmid maintenance system antidote protein VapI